MESAPQGKIGRYVIQGELGRGAMGIVYRAQDPAIGRTVAVKTIRIGQFTDERELRHVQERMMREAQAAGILSHTNIVTIYDIQADADTAFIFMEYVDGETLEKILLADTPIDKQLIIHLLKQAAEALDYAHQRGIVHRDIKPANIMVRRDGIAKIADFGIARMQSHSMTQAGQILGTPNYMSPEQISGKPVDGRADQYSLGVMLYEVLTGEKPFVADSLPTLLFRVVSEPPQPAPRLNPTLSPAIDEVIQRALAKEPADRFPSCSDFIRALERACESAPGWKTLARGGGLSQPTHAAVAPPSAPKPFVMPPAEPPAPAPAKPGKVQSIPVPLVPPAPKPSSDPPGGINTMAIVAVALAAALVGAVVIGAKLVHDKREAARIATAVPAPPLAAPVEAPKTTPAPEAQPPVTAEPKPVDAPPTPAPKPAPSNPLPAPGSAGATPGARAVAIRTTPEGARVVIDDGKVAPCTSPCLVELPPGRHSAAMMLEPYKTEMRIFFVPQESSIDAKLEKKTGMLEISSNPPGASITIDGNPHSEKTPARIQLPIGKHLVVVSLPGRQPYSRTFEMRTDATISLQPDWSN